MSDALRPMGRTRLHEQVIDRLRAYVAEGGLHAGDRLPAERELAQRLGVSRASVKQAVVVLEVQGLVEARHGGGTYLLKNSLDVEPVEQLAERRRRLPDVLDAREALETKLAELAAARRTDDDLAALRAALAHMEREIADGGHGPEGDRRFHAAVTAAAHSALLAEFMRSIAEQIAESRHESLRQPGRPARSLAQHRAILDAIEAGRPKAAAAAMRRHVHTVAKVRLLDWTPDGEGDGGRRGRGRGRVEARGRQPRSTRPSDSAD
ncbi:FadR family transcriptional regulator [Streptomyces armeniacus]|uniref:FadR family transcriptional regulator n=1 Tax=Streptomyces armeniacus TaxID=83291 RepID=A0A345XJT2_9ACTN|nr:FCD domain-containing protein [Streptomyces armeniacus]AXK31898.1 FadR family transcriptional regulator [Streptomyces armeniacus]